MNNIYFTSDLHFGHKNIVKYTDRPFKDEEDTNKHDKWLIDIWNSKIDKKDTVYILGDLTFHKSENARKLLEKLHGKKFMIEGNHDGSIRAYKNYFSGYTQIHEWKVTPNILPVLTENLFLVMCHYPMVTWSRKPHGSIMLHGHCHGRLDEYNTSCTELRFDVGFDSELGKKYGGFISLEDIYNEAINKVGTTDFRGYAQAQYDQDKR